MTSDLLDLSLSHAKMGKALFDAKCYGEALDAYRKSEEIFDKLVTADPENVELQGYLSVGYEKVGDTLSICGSKEEALEFYRKGLAIRRSKSVKRSL